MPVRFVITGFGPFGPVLHNPSGMLAHRFDASAERKLGKQMNGTTSYQPQQTQWYIDHCEQIDVNCDAVKEFWQRRRDVEEQRIQKAETDDITVYVHMGVGNKFTEIHFETVARNQCVFSAPDTKGLLLVNKPVIEGEPEKLRCGLPIYELCKKFDEIQASEGRTLLSYPSLDAGGYLCNYVFYHSLNFTTNFENYHSMFLHLPNLEKVDIDTQYTGVHTVLQMVADRLCPPPHELCVVPITTAMIPAVVPLLDEYRAVKQEGESDVDPLVVAHLEGIIEDKTGSSAFLIAHKAGKDATSIPTDAVIGFMEMSAVNSAALLGRSYIVTDLFVKPGARREGIGRTLLKGGVDVARSRGASRLSATIEDSESVRMLMEKEGWRHLAGQCSVILAL